jgi:hypothetical protein
VGACRTIVLAGRRNALALLELLLLRLLLHLGIVLRLSGAGRRSLYRKSQTDSGRKHGCRWHKLHDGTSLAHFFSPEPHG